MKRIPHLLTALFALLVLTSTTQAQYAPQYSNSVRNYISVDAPVVVLQNATVIDGTGAQPMSGQTIVIRNGVIADVGPTGSVAAPDGAEIIDMTGKTVIPGLIGLHNHTFYTTSQRRIQLDRTAPMLYLASGVTTVRTTGSYAPYSEIGLKRAINAGNRVGPRMFITGPYITGGDLEDYTYMTRVDGADNARRVVRYWSEEGVDWFKAYTLISREELAAAIEEAHAHGIKVTGHLCSVSFREAVALGIDNLEHGYFTNTDYEEGKQPDSCPGNFRAGLLDMDMSSGDVQQTFREMIDAGVAMTSTQAIYEHVVPNRPPLEQRVLDAMSPEVREEYLQRRAEIAEGDSELWKRLFPKAQEYEKAFVDAGGLLGAGVDPTGYGGALPGYGDQRNFELLLESGFDMATVVQIMSLNGARILDIADETGSIEVGKHADLVVINGNLVDDPAAIRNTEIVFRQGTGFDSAKLIEDIQGTVGVQ